MASAAPSVEQANGSTRQIGPGRALQDLQYQPIVTDLSEMSSEEDIPEGEGYPDGDAQSVIGVAISQAQARLASPKTPAAEKAAAMESLEGGGLFDDKWEPAEGAAVEQEPVETMGKTTNKETEDQTPSEPSPPLPQKDTSGQQSSPERLPSPWRAGPKRFKRQDGTRGVLRDSFSVGRQRSSSGSSISEGIRQMLPPNLTSMPKTSDLNFKFPSFSASSLFDGSSSTSSEPSFKVKKTIPAAETTTYGQVDGNGDLRVDRRLRTSPANAGRRVTVQQCVSPTSQNQPSRSENTGPSIGHHATTFPIELNRSNQAHRPEPISRASSLRRSKSDESLFLHRTLSRASSLGDDSRFEHVQEQVNSRIKAIRDSWQDANIRLPSMPSFPNFNIGSSFTDLNQTRLANTFPRTASIRGNRRSVGASPAGREKRMPSRKAPSPKTSINPETAGMTPNNAANYPYFTKALRDLTGDVVILGGYRGSILRSAEFPHRQLWAPVKVGLNLRKVDLEIGLDPKDEETMEERIIPDGMLTHIGPVDISRRLFKRLRASENARNGTLRVHDYGYDWRLSPHLLSKQLQSFLASLPCNSPGTPPEQRGATVIAHSLGGLITRHAINEQPDLVSGVVYAGVPQTCVNILGPLRNGDDVLLSSRVLTAQVNFTIRTSFALLPLDGKCFFDKNTKEEYPVDFFNVNTWIEHSLSPCVSSPLPPSTPPPATGISGVINSMGSLIPNISIISRKSSMSKSGPPSPPPSAASATAKAESKMQSAKQEAESGAPSSGMAPQMNNNSQNNPAEYGQSTNASISTAVTLPRQACIDYLTRTLAETKQFKDELTFRPSHAKANLYPPIAVIYGKSTPTVYGAKVNGRDNIKRADAYDELAFASGDGVVLARAAMVPEGYKVVRGGVVASERGHVTLLGDLESVGRCIGAVLAGKKAGIGRGLKKRERRTDIKGKNPS